MSHAIIFLNNHLPIVTSALIDTMDLAFGEASFKPRASVCHG